MIFVTIGTHTQGFGRLIKAVDELAGAGKIKEKVIMQIGNTEYEPKNCEWFRFESFKRILALNRTARAVITHAGAGCVITALRFGKPLIIMPRLKKFGEHVDDHQCDLADALAREKKAFAANNTKELEDALKKAPGARQKSKKSALINNLKKYLEEQESLCLKKQRL